MARAERLAPGGQRTGPAPVPAGPPARVLDLRPAYERPAIQPFHRRRWQVLTLVTVSADLVWIAAALTAVTLLVPPGPDGWAARWFAAWLIPWWLGIAAAGLYDARRTENPVEELRRILYGVTIGGAVTIVVSFWLRIPLSREWIFWAWVVILIASALGRRVVRKTVHSMRRRGRLRRRALIVGADPSGVALARDVARAPWAGLDLVGFVSVDGERLFEEDGLGIPVVGESVDLRELAVSLAVADVLLAPSVTGNGGLRTIVSALDGVPVDLKVAPGLDGFLTSRLSIHPLGERALIAIERPELRPLARVTKRGIDIVLGTGLLLLVTPLILVMALAIKLGSPGPAFFRQSRIGLRGRRFRMWKLRTMTADAEEKLIDLGQRNEAGDVLFKIRDDPRVTSLGRVLRRWSIDELPQLVNVILGQMSLVGPRPPLPIEVERYDDTLGRRLLVKPGMTGLWQVSGRNELSFQDYVRYDLLYVQNWSLALDLYILAKTLPAVLAGRGAF